MNAKFKNPKLFSSPGAATSALAGQWVSVRADDPKSGALTSKVSYKRYRMSSNMLPKKSAVFDSRTAVDMLHADPAPTKALLDILALD